MADAPAQRRNRQTPRRRARGRHPFSARLPAPLRRWSAATIAPIVRTLLAPPVLAILLIALPALFLAYQYQRPRQIDVGVGNDTFYLRGAFAPERGAGTDFRWLSDIGEIVIPDAPGNSTWDATLRLSGERPPDASPPPVEVRADDRLVARFDTIAAFKDYTFSFARSALPSDELHLTITTTTFDPPGDLDNRPLGVALDNVVLTPEREGGNEPFVFPLSYAAIVLGLLIGLVARQASNDG